MTTTTLTATLSSLVAGRAVDGAELQVTAPAVRDTAGDVLYAGGTTRVPFDQDGRLAIDLLPTDAPGAEPSEWAYRFRLAWRGGSLPAFSAAVTGEEVDLTDLQPVDPADPVYIPARFELSRVVGLADYVDVAVDDAAAVHKAGVELAYGERTSNAVTTSVTATAPLFPAGLTAVGLIGQGRPVDIEVWWPAAYHSVGGTAVIVSLWVNSVNVAQVAVWSSRANTGQPGNLRKRIVLPDGVSHNIAVGVYGEAAGSATVRGSTSTPCYLSVVSR